MVGGKQRDLVVGATLAVQALSVVALAAYLFTVFAAWQAYRATTTYVDPTPRRLEAYLSRADEVVKRTMIRVLWPRMRR